MAATETNLRIACGEVITFSKLQKESKTQLLKFVKEEADLHQIKGFLLDGEIKTNLDEESRSIIDDRFETSKFNEIDNVGLILKR